MVKLHMPPKGKKEGRENRKPLTARTFCGGPELPPFSNNFFLMHVIKNVNKEVEENQQSQVEVLSDMVSVYFFIGIENVESFS